MHIDVLRSFRLVAEYKSISKASEKLYLTQPAISKQIKSLEDEYGVELFDRTKKEMILTESGRQLLEYVYRILSLYNDSKISISQSCKRVKGTLTIGVNMTIGIYVLPRLMQPYCEAYPDVYIKVLMYNTDRVINALKKNEISFGIVGVKPDQNLFVSHRFYEDKIKVVVKPGYVKSKKTISWEELQGLPFITRERGSDIRKCCEEWLGMKGIVLKPKAELNNTEAVKKCIRSGVGFSLLPWCTVDQDVQDGVLAVLSAPYLNNLVQQHYISHYRDRRFSKPERLFLGSLFQAIETGDIVPKPNVGGIK